MWNSLRVVVTCGPGTMHRDTYTFFLLRRVVNARASFIVILPSEVGSLPGNADRSADQMWQTKQLLFHGAVVLLIGFACGAPMGRSIVRGRPEAVVRAWRVAHSSLVAGGA